MGSLFGGGKPSTTTTTSNTTVNIPEWARGPLERSVNRAETLSNQPFTPYDPAQTVAPLSADELAAFDIIRQQAGQYLPFVDQAINQQQSLLNRVVGGPSSADIQSRMNPYLNQLLDTRMQRAERQFDIENQKLQDLGQSAGAYGGSRLAVSEDELRDQYLDRLSDIEAQEMYNAFNVGLGQYNLENQLGMQGAGQLAALAGQGQGQITNQASLLQLAGQQDRLIQQGLADANLAEFNRELTFPYEQINFLSGTALGPAGLYQGQTSSVGTQTISQPRGSTFGNILGAGLSIAGMASGIPGVSAALGNAVGPGVANALGFAGTFSGATGSGGYNTSYFPGAGGNVYWNPRLAEGGQVPWLKIGPLLLNDQDREDYAQGKKAPWLEIDKDMATEWLSNSRLGKPAFGLEEDTQRLGKDLYGFLDSWGQDLRDKAAEPMIGQEGSRLNRLWDTMTGASDRAIAKGIVGTSKALGSGIEYMLEDPDSYEAYHRRMMKEDAKAAQKLPAAAPATASGMVESAGTTEQGVPVETLKTRSSSSSSSSTSPPAEFSKAAKMDPVQERYGGINLPLMMAGIAMLQDDGDVWDNLAAGFGGYAQGKEAVYQTKKEAAKAELENALAQTQMMETLAKTDLYRAQAIGELWGKDPNSFDLEKLTIRRENAQTAAIELLTKDFKFLQLPPEEQIPIILATGQRLMDEGILPEMASGAEGGPRRQTTEDLIQANYSKTIKKN